MKSKKTDKLYIVRKYVMAKSAQEALRKSRSVKPDDCWVDDDFKKGENKTQCIGYMVNQDDDIY